MNIKENRDTATSGGAVRRRTLRSTPIRRVIALSALGVAGVTLAACGSSSSASTTSSAAASTGGSGGGAGGNGALRQFPGTSGTIAAVNGTSIEVQNPTTGQTTVSYTASTTFRQTVATSASAVTVGSCISAFGKPASGSSSSTGAFGNPITATTVSVTQPTSGSCTGGFGGPGRRSSTGGTSGTPAAGGTFPGGTRPGGSGGRRFGNGQFGAASGPVTAVNGSSVTVDENNPLTKKTASVVVTLTASTTFTTTGTGSPADLVVGKCARAVGSASTTGAITAQSITVSAPGANGCTSGFGGFRGGAAGAGAGAPTGA